jgi:hypothetical protein
MNRRAKQVLLEVVLVGRRRGTEGKRRVNMVSVLYMFV